MKDLNIKFLDLYKSVDRFIRDAYSSDEGVSEYIREMDKNEYSGIRYVGTWKEDRDMLKHLRWIRNQLVHEVSYDSDICSKNDYDRLRSFYDRLYSAEDPLASMDKKKRAEKQRYASEQRRIKTVIYEHDEDEIENVRHSAHKNKMTLWEKIKKFFH